MQTRLLIILICISVYFIPFIPSSMAQSDKDPSDQESKVLVIMSYHEEYASTQEIRSGIESVLKSSELKYFFMDTKRNLDQGKAKAEEAFSIYQSFKPDAVIAADDNAQSLFVVPYLKEKVKTPVIFCGVNNDANKFGYPAINVTGILEKKHYREGIHLVKLINQQINKIAVLYKNSPSNSVNIGQIKKEKGTYPVEIIDYVAVISLKETMLALEQLETEADALILLNLTGISDANGKPLEGEEALSLVTDKWSKPTIAASHWEIEAGVLCGVVKSMVEQGTVAGQMVQHVLTGKPLKEIPITQNKNGKRIINITTAQKLNIKLKPMVLLGTELVN